MDLRILRGSLIAAVPLLAVPGPSPARAVLGAVRPAPFLQRQPSPQRVTRKVGLGATLTTKDGGQVFGFDINHHGDDGVLASAQTTTPSGTMVVSVETFDQNTGKITKSFAKAVGMRDSYAVDGIFAGDVALVTHYVTPKGTIYAKRLYDVMNPVTAEKFTGRWTPPIKDIDVLQATQDQDTTESLLFAIELKNQDQPDLVVTDVAKNTIQNTIHLDPNLFNNGSILQMGQFTAANQGVIAMSPDGGRVGGAAPINVLVDLKTGKTKQFNGLNEGPYGSGFVNGLAVDPNTGIAATTTELNAQVEFYDLMKQTGIAVQLPCTGPSSQINSGAGIVVDPLNKLFLVTDPYYNCTGQGSALVVYDEHGAMIETITGFKFAIGEPPPAINPSKRMGWAFGPAFSQLQQFFY